MKSSDLIEKLESLLPEIKQSKDPAGTLLKFAAKENMAPALLEKMGHQYNTAKTLAFMDKSANRGSTFSLLDVPDMMARYTETDSIKSANEEIIKSASAGIRVSQRFPDMELKEREIFIKQSSTTETPEISPLQKYKDLQEKKATFNREVEILRQVHDDYREYLVKSFEKIARRIYSEDLPFQEIEDDCLCELGSSVRPVLNDLADYLGRQSVKVARMSQPSRRSFYEDRHKMVPIIKEAADFHTVFYGADRVLKKLAANKSEHPSMEDVLRYNFGDVLDSAIQGKQEEDVETDDEIKIPHTEHTTSRNETSDDGTAVEPESTVVVIDTPESEPVSDGEGDRDSEPDAKAEPIPDPETAPDQGNSDEGTSDHASQSPSGRDNRKNQPSSQSPSGHANRNNQPSSQSPSGHANRKNSPNPSQVSGKSNRRSNMPPTAGNSHDFEFRGPPNRTSLNPAILSTSVGKLVNWGDKIQPVKDPLSVVTSAIDMFKGRNKKQEAIDTAFDDEVFSSGLSRLLHSDPILSEADPNLVASLASSIRQTNPTAASDPNYLKFALREAVQYGALPHHTTKDLNTMRRERAQADELELKYNNALYG